MAKPHVTKFFLGRRSTTMTLAHCSYAQKINCKTLLSV